MSWGDKKTVKKGDFGEEIVRKHLIAKGLIPYRPDFDGAHPFDFLCASLNKKNIIIADAKAKSRMNKVFDCGYRTGIDTRHYNEYKHLELKYNIPVHLYFVDELERKIYGNTLKELEKNMIDGWWNPPMKLFRLSDMIVVSMLSDEQCNKLVELSTRNYEYEDGSTKQKLI